MSKAVGMALILFLVVLLGTHPGSAVHLLEAFFGVVQRAGNELSSFVSQL